MLYGKKRGVLLIALCLIAAGCALPLRPAGHRFQSDRISVVTEGSGPDVVLIPGLGSSPEVWRGLVRSLPGHRFHLVHVSGFAGRPAAANGQGPIIAPVADEIARYVREARLRKPSIIGHSLGGSIALSLAARHDVASKVMVVDMLPYLGLLFAPPGAGSDAVRKTADGIRDRALAASPEVRLQTIERSIDTMVMTEELRAAPARAAFASDQEVSARALHELIVTDLRPELARIHVPVTILYVKTPNVPLDAKQFDALYRTSYAGLSNAVLKRIPDSYHFIMYDQPEHFAQEVRAFLE